MSILDSLLSVISGGATGLIGTAVQSIYQYKTRQLDIDLEKTKAANELEQRKLDIQMQAQEWASRTHIAEITTQGEVDKADAEVLGESYKLEPQQYSEKTLLTHAQNWIFVFIDALRAIIRPAMTIYLSIIVTFMYFETRALVTQGSGEPIILLEKLVNTVLYVFTTVCLWWYGSRNPAKKI